jgi:hypothetical protein
MHEGKVFACQVLAGRAPEVTPTRTKPIAPWANRDPVPRTPPSGQPEGHLR